MNVIFILDESGSMQPVKHQVISGVNEYIQSLKGHKITLMKFNGMTGTRTVYFNTPAEAIHDFTDYHPAGTTPLLDAIGEAITKHSHLNDVLFIIQTDGEENTSREYSLQHVSELIADKKQAGWKFVFMGADIDSWSIARKLNLERKDVLSYRGLDTGQTMKLVADASQQYFADPTRGFFDKNT